jgi:hypothetical protein
MTSETATGKVFNVSVRPESTASRLRLANTYLWLIDAGDDDHRLGYIERLDRIHSERVMISTQNVPDLLAMAEEVTQATAWQTPAWASPNMTLEREA